MCGEPAALAPEPGGLLVRPEAADAWDAIRALHDAAFGKPDEGRIVDGVRGEP